MPLPLNTDLHLSEAELIVGLKAQNQDVFEVLYDMYAGSLYGIILRIIKKEPPAEDILQETFIKIWQSFNSYDPEKGRLFTWMRNIAKNLSIDYLRTKAHHNDLKNDDVAAIMHVVDVKYHLSTNLDTIGIKQMAMKLEPKYKAILHLVYFTGYSHSEAAELLGIPVGTLKTRIRMAVKILRGEFNSRKAISTK